MDYSVTFARHFSRLVWLLMHESGAIDEQKAALRALVTVSKDGKVTLSPQQWNLVVNETPLPEAVTGVQELAARLVAHNVVEVRVDQGATPADLLGIARILSAEQAAGQTIEPKLAALDAKTVRVVLMPPPSRPGSRDSAMMAPVAPAKPSEGAPPLAGWTGSPNTPQGAPVISAERHDTPQSRSAIPAPSTTVGSSHTGGASGVPSDASTTGVSAVPLEDDSSGMMFMAFSAVQIPKGSAGELLRQLDGTKSMNVITRVLDELVTLAENAGREGKADIVSDVFFGIVTRETDHQDPDEKRAFVMAVRRMSKPTLLRGVAQLLPRRRERLEQYMAILTRAGEDGADALIEQLTAAQSLSDRRVFFDSLVKLNAGVPALIHMLGDARWYVARNAADLLGEMQAVEAETPLTELLKHDDDRVRRAAATALAKLGTPKAVQALHTALRDPSPQVRLQAAAGLSSRKGQKSATTLSKALDEEPDSEVQLAILEALGRLGTPDAVQKLIKAAEPDGRLFKKKPLPYRIAAVKALGEARTPAALTALQALLNDKEKEVKEAVFRVVMARNTGEQSVIVEESSAPR